jgi:hypothetical protein
VSTWSEYIVCPLHYPVRGECSADCLERRMEYVQAASALRTYWYDRRLGKPPMSLAEYRARFGLGVRT